jgi:hypothetical protein
MHIRESVNAQEAQLKAISIVIFVAPTSSFLAREWIERPVPPSEKTVEEAVEEIEEAEAEADEVIE